MGVLQLQEKNYTNPEDRGRFGFSMSGDFYTPYKFETVLVIALIAVAVTAGLALFFIVSKISVQSRIEQESNADFVVMGSIIAIIVFVAILIVIFGVGVKSVKKGFKCSYTANDETFTATIGGDLHVIQYKDVASVSFLSRDSFGKIRGYDILIKMNNGKEESFSICSDGYLSPQATPFYIIQERIEILRRARSKPPVQNNALKANSKALTQAEVERKTTGGVSAMDKMAQLLGETSNMPELSVDATPAQRAVAEITKVMNEYSSDEMPAIGEKKRPQDPNTYLGTDGREYDINTVQAQGVYYVKPDRKKVVLFEIVILLAWTGVMFGVAMLLIGAILIAFAYLVLPAYIVTAPFIFYNVLTKTRGALYNYKADGRGFYITSKKGNDQILYKDVLSIDYTPTKLLRGARGYTVEILMTYGMIKIDYIFPRFNHPIPKQYLPFEAIRRNIPKRDNKE